MDVPSQQYDTKVEPDMLQLNMDSISKELNDLIVMGEHEFGMCQQYSPAITTNEPRPITKQSLPPTLNNYQDSVYLINNLYGQPQSQNRDGHQHTKPNLKYFANFSVAPLNYGFNTGNGYNPAITCYTSPNYLCASTNMIHPTLGSSQSTTFTTATPTYEFHYLKSTGNSERKNFRSNSVTGNSLYRKTPKFINKYNNQKTQTPTPTLDNENIKIDLAKLDLLKQGFVKNEVQQLFDLLRDLHRALAEMSPNFETHSDSQYVDTFAPLPSIKALMSMTLNVQNQVKQACRKLVIFYCEMQRIMNTNKVYDPNMFAECEYYLYSLHQNITKLEVYKRIEMEHKRGQFLREDVKVHAERLSLLLEQIVCQVREVRLRILAFDWYMSVKYRGEVCLAFKAKNNNDNTANVKTLPVGVINKILQMCNETTANSTIAATTTKATANSDLEINLNSNTEYNKDMVNTKMLFIKNNEIIATDQIKSKVYINANTARHPVFYIG